MMSAMIRVVVAQYQILVRRAAVESGHGDNVVELYFIPTGRLALGWVEPPFGQVSGRSWEEDGRMNAPPRLGPPCTSYGGVCM